jgi:DNA polymerase I-like protein with 3'-5' exonuclease and polymerase domains
MRYVAFDTETYLIEPGKLAPRLVCTSVCYDLSSPVLLFDRADSEDVLKLLLEDKDVILVGHNVAFDMGVICANYPQLFPLVWEAYKQDRVRDTYIRAQLRSIALGRFSFDPELGKLPSWSLSELAEQYLGVELDKNTWRLRYSELDGSPVEEWPEGAKDYAKEDARVTLAIWDKWKSDPPPDEGLQCRAAWALHLTSCWGLKTDQGAVSRLEKALRDEVEKYDDRLVDLGFVRTDGSKNTKKIRSAVLARFQERGMEPPRSKTNLVRANEDTLRQANCPDLEILADSLGTKKLLTSFIPRLTPIVNPRFRVLVRSGRTSCRNPNVQQLPRKGGIRECFIPRNGWVYVDADYHVAELCGLAEVCQQIFKFSKLGEALREGKDPHLVMGAQILGKDYGDALKAYKRYSKAKDAGKTPTPMQQRAADARQMAKAANFGFPGGLGIQKFIQFARDAYGIELTPQRATKLKTQWFARYPEMKIYFRWIGEHGENFRITQLRSNRIRGNCTFTSGCNTMFQGLVADGAKDALWAVAYECYTGSKFTGGASPLYGCRPVNFVHDQIVIEARREKAEEAAKRLEDVMIAKMAEWITTVPIKADSQILERWRK